MTQEYTKRDGTSQESELAILANMNRWNGMNPSYQTTLESWQEKHAEAVKEGYKTEICSCGITFLAFHHLVDCYNEGCPMRGQTSLLDMFYPN